MWHDKVLLLFMIWAFSLRHLQRRDGGVRELHNAPIAVVDEDRSPLSQRIATRFLPPVLPAAGADRPGGHGPRTGHRPLHVRRSTSRRNFQRDVQAGRQPDVQLNIDATRDEPGLHRRRLTSSTS